MILSAMNPAHGIHHARSAGRIMIRPIEASGFDYRSARVARRVRYRAKKKGRGEMTSIQPVEAEVRQPASVAKQDNEIALACFSAPAQARDAACARGAQISLLLCPSRSRCDARLARLSARHHQRQPSRVPPKPRRRKTMSNKQLPSHIAYVVTEPKEGSDKKATWHQVGTVWPHQKGGRGFDLVIPPGVTLSGRIVCIERKEKDEQPNAK
jgi:hypothetical protein